MNNISMNNINKYELMQEILVNVNDLIDLKGVDKCVLAIQIVQKLNTIQGLMKDEDKNYEAAIKELTSRIDALTPLTEVKTDEDTDTE